MLDACARETHYPCFTHLFYCNEKDELNNASVSIRRCLSGGALRSPLQEQRADQVYIFLCLYLQRNTTIEEIATNSSLKVKMTQTEVLRN